MNKPERDEQSLNGTAYVDYEEYDGDEPEEDEYDDADVEEVEYADIAAPDQPRAQSSTPIILAALAGVVLVVGLVAWMLTRPAPDGTTTGDSAQSIPVNSNVERPQAGYLAPDFTLAGLNGGTVKLSSFRGQKAVWLNFWATWCQPCRVEMPAMEKLYPEYNDQMEIIGVDIAEPEALVRDYVQAGAYSWAFALDPDSVAFRRYFSTGVPTHAFIKKDGRISSIIIGGLPELMMTAEIEKMLQ